MRHKIYLNVQTFIADLVLNVLLYGRYAVIDTNIELNFHRRFSSIDEYVNWATKQVIIDLQKYNKLLADEVQIQDLYIIMDQTRSNDDVLFDIEQLIRTIVPFTLYIETKDTIYESYFELIECYLEDILLAQSYQDFESLHPSSRLDYNLESLDKPVMSQTLEYALSSSAMANPESPEPELSDPEPELSMDDHLYSHEPEPEFSIDRPKTPEPELSMDRPKTPEPELSIGRPKTPEPELSMGRPKTPEPELSMDVHPYSHKPDPELSMGRPKTPEPELSMDVHPYSHKPDPELSMGRPKTPESETPTKEPITPDDEHLPGEEKSQLDEGKPKRQKVEKYISLTDTQGKEVSFKRYSCKRLDSESDYEYDQRVLGIIHQILLDMRENQVQITRNAILKIAYHADIKCIEQAFTSIVLKIITSQDGWTADHIDKRILKQILITKANVDAQRIFAQSKLLELLRKHQTKLESSVSG
jgi:hypothetical protein